MLLHQPLRPSLLKGQHASRIRNRFVLHAVSLSMPTKLFVCHARKFSLKKSCLLWRETARAKEVDVKRCRCCERQRAKAAGWPVLALAFKEERPPATPSLLHRSFFFHGTYFFDKQPFKKVCVRMQSRHMTVLTDPVGSLIAGASGLSF